MTLTYGSFVGGGPKVNRWRQQREVPATSKESDALSKDLKCSRLQVRRLDDHLCAHAGDRSRERPPRLPASATKPPTTPQVAASSRPIQPHRVSVCRRGGRVHCRPAARNSPASRVPSRGRLRPRARRRDIHVPQSSARSCSHPARICARGNYRGQRHRLGELLIAAERQWTRPPRRQTETRRLQGGQWAAMGRARLDRQRETRLG